MAKLNLLKARKFFINKFFMSPRETIEFIPSVFENITDAQKLIDELYLAWDACSCLHKPTNNIDFISFIDTVVTDFDASTVTFPKPREEESKENNYVSPCIEKGAFADELADTAYANTDVSAITVTELTGQVEEALEFSVENIRSKVMSELNDDIDRIVRENIKRELASKRSAMLDVAGDMDRIADELKSLANTVKDIWG